MEFSTNTQKKNLIDFLQQQTSDQPKNPAFTFIENDQARSLSYEGLHSQARAIAAGLLAKMSPGDRLILLCPPGLDYIRLFYGCLIAGVVAVPLYPPRKRQRTDRLDAVIASCGAKFAATSGDQFQNIQQFFQNSDALGEDSILCVDELLISETLAMYPELKPDELAFIQYTSGSTGTPKGVMIEHRNIVANLQALQDTTGCHGDDVFVNWLPLFHDLGLLNTLMLPVFLGSHSVLMSPASFVHEPRRWLQAMSEYRGTIGGAPNFAFDLCVDKIKDEQLDGLNLSNWRIAFNAAEPIKSETLTAFTEKFASVGFKSSAIYASYGMAEATVFLCGGKTIAEPVLKNFDVAQFAQGKVTDDSDASQLKTHVGCGQIAKHHKLLIVDPTSKEIKSDGKIGEIWVSGPSIARGYWQLDDINNTTFQAKTQCGKGPFLRTGDFGCIHEGELFICGRIKDVMIVRGVNIYPQDVELAALRSHESNPAKEAIAFQVDGEETVTLVQELKSVHVKSGLAQELCEAISAAITQQFELKTRVLFIKAGTLPKTSSGKAQRSAAKRFYLEGELAIVHSQSQVESLTQHSDLRSLNDTERKIREIWCKVLNRQDISGQSELYALGADSLDMTCILSRIQATWPVSLDMEQLYDSCTISDQAKLVSNALRNTSAPELQPIRAHKTLSGPASNAQKRIWYMNQVDTSNAMLNLPVVLKLAGKLNLSEFADAVSMVLAKHKIFHTVYSHTEEGLIQLLLNDASPVVQLLDLSTASNKQAKLEAEIDQLQACQFDLENGPVYKATLISLSEQETFFLFSVHHIAADAWSLENLIRQINCAYCAKPSAELDLEYLDYSIWQYKDSVQAQLQKGQQYFLKHLNGSPKTSVIPTDYVRPARQTFSGTKHSVSISKELAESLSQLSTQHNVTLFTTLFSGFQYLLYRLSGQHDLVIGTDVANRQSPETQALCGFFVNQLALRNQVDSQSSFSELLTSNGKVIKTALAHQSVPFDSLIEKLGIVRQQHHSPLFQVKFLLNANPLESFTIPGIEISKQPLAVTTAQYDVTLSIDPQGDGSYSANFHYNTDLFAIETVQQCADDYVALLTQVLQKAGSPLSLLPIASASLPQKHGYAIGHDNQTLQGQSIASMFVEKAAQQPDKTALIYAQQHISYRELSKRAAQLASFLCDICPENGLIGVHIPRSVEQVVCLLAISRLAQTFVPLDPDYPESRVHYMLENSEVEMVITFDAGHPHLEDYWGSVIELIDAEQFADESTEIGHFPQAKENAYLLYTSGSTGQPKGVLISHNNLFNLCRWYIDFAELNGETRLLQPIPLSFDASIKNIFSPLMTGGTLVLPDQGPFDPAKLLQQIKEHQVSIINCVPSFIYPLVDLAAVEYYAQLRSMRLLALGGEATDLQRLNGWLNNSNCETLLANIYGPTECTDISVAWKGDARDLRGAMPIGRPIYNVSVEVLNGDGSPANYGVAGELRISGAGVGNGYLGSASANQRFSQGEHGKQFLTGDLVRWDRDGQLEYLGRQDRQIKLNGIRIEVAELEKQLCAISGIDASRVLNVSDKLIAFVEPSDLTPPTPQQMRERLARHFPNSWLPKAFITLPQLPLLPNGKVDEKQLAGIDIPEQLLQREVQAPASELEGVVLSAWQTGLERDGICVADNFFDLGGDSIIAVKIVALLNEHGVKTSVTHLFEAPTIIGLAEKIKDSEEQLVETEEVQTPGSTFDMLDADDLEALMSSDLT